MGVSRAVISYFTGNSSVVRSLLHYFFYKLRGSFGAVNSVQLTYIASMGATCF